MGGGGECCGGDKHGKSKVHNGSSTVGLVFFLFSFFIQQIRCLTSFVRFREKLAITTTKSRGNI